MTLETMKTYGAIKERSQYVSLEDDLKRLEEIEQVFEHIQNRENRFIFRLLCMGYSYPQILQSLQKNGCYIGETTLRGRVFRIIKKLRAEGVLSDGQSE